MVEPFRYEPRSRLLIVVGNFGSGKTEVSVNLALRLAESRTVRIVDLDSVNLYFRCREAREEMEARGIRVIYPQGEYHSADLPIILPEVKGALAEPEGLTILDVGGDDLGARVLASLADFVPEGEYSMLLVLNAKRPFTEDVAGCLRMKEEIEQASRLRVTGLISNTHLMEETTEETVREGLALASAVAEAAGIDLELATASQSLLPGLEEAAATCPFLPIERRMLPPWLLERKADRADWIRKHG
ncbi:MAG: cobalamin biosynthesis protein CbiA [Planctomycetota bacterium]|jgi:hypothetical protein